ncbi:MAG: hypothetical protein QXF14_02240, partial [Candidatus Woesearchaeota archaeon]
MAEKTMFNNTLIAKRALTRNNPKEKFINVTSYHHHHTKEVHHYALEQKRCVRTLNHGNSCSHHCDYC